MLTEPVLPHKGLFPPPQTGSATDFDLYARSVLPSGTGFTSGQISTIHLSGNEIFYICWMHNSFTGRIRSAGSRSSWREAWKS